MACARSMCADWWSGDTPKATWTQREEGQSHSRLLTIVFLTINLYDSPVRQALRGDLLSLTTALGRLFWIPFFLLLIFIFSSTYLQYMMITFILGSWYMYITHLTSFYFPFLSLLYLLVFSPFAKDLPPYFLLSVSYLLFNLLRYFNFFKFIYI